MRVASFNVLADAYTSYGDYSHVDPELMKPQARTDTITKLIDSLEADIVGLQESEPSLVEALHQIGVWQTFWSPKGHGKPDGCLTLVKPGIGIDSFDTYDYRDDSGHIAQIIRIGGVAVTNSHIKWSPPGNPYHIGVSQAIELLDYLNPDEPAVILADINDEPGGPVRNLLTNRSFTDLYADIPTAFVNQKPVTLDLLAVRGLAAKRITGSIDAAYIPNESCPSDHIPLVADIDFGRQS